MPRIFCATYQYLSAGSVYTDGLANAAKDLGIPFACALWDDPGLLGSVQRFKSDLLLAVHGRRLCQLYRRWPVENTAVILTDEPYETDDSSQWSSRFTHVFVNDAATLDRHANSHYFGACHDPHRHKPRDGAKAHGVGFIGGANPTRERYLSVLAKHGLLSYVVGGPWGDPAVQARCLSRNITPDAAAALYQQTKIVVNVFRDMHHYNARKTPATALNPRVYEATACGALVVSEWRPEVATVCPELPTFRDEYECVTMVKDFLIDQERREVLQQICAKRLSSHTYADRLATVMRVACGVPA